MPTYGSALAVQGRAGGRPFDAPGGAGPTLLRVEAWLDETEAQLIGAIQMGGGPSSYVTTSRGGLILRDWAETRVAGIFRMSSAGAGGDGSNDDGQDIEDRWERLLDRLRSNTANILAMLDSSGVTPPDAIGIGSHATDATLALTAADVAPTFTIAGGRGGAGGLQF